jgi:hypothetical protein
MPEPRGYAKNNLRLTFRITAPARQAVQALQKPLESGGPRKPGRGLVGGCPPGPRGSREPTTPPNSQGLRRLPGPSCPPTDTAGPGAPLLANSDRVSSPRLPVLTGGKNGQYSGCEGRGRDSDTEDSPIGWPRCYCHDQGARIRVSQVLGQQGGRYQEILVSATPLPSAQVCCHFRSGPAPHVP